MSDLTISPPSLFIGETISGGTAGSVLVSSNATGLLAQDNANLFYDIAQGQLITSAIYGGTASSSSFTLGAGNTGFSPANTGRIQFYERVNFNLLTSNTSAVISSALITSTATTTNSSATIVFPFVLDSRTIRYSVNQSLSQSPTLNAALIFQPTANGISDVANNFAGFTSVPAYVPDVGVSNSATTANVGGFSGNPKAGPVVSGSGTITNFYAFKSWGFNFFSFDINANLTVTNAYHLDCSTLLNAGTVTNHYIINMPEQTVGTNIRGISSALSAASNKFFIRHSGTAISNFTGGVRVGDTTAVTDIFEVLGNARVTGLLKIGSDATAAAGVDMASGQANHLRMAGHTAAPASPTSGDHWYNTTKQAHNFQATVGTQGLVGKVFANTANATAVANTTTETNFDQSFSLPANSMTSGKVLRFVASGVYSTTGTPTLNFRFKLGTTAMLDFGTTATFLNASNRTWRIEGELVFRAAPGASVATQASGEINLENAATTILVGASYPVVTNTNVATNGALVAQLSAQWSAASSSNTTTMNTFVLETLD